jgi:peptidoglycan/LPS O-acetylase OafA/YrhL
VRTGGHNGVWPQIAHPSAPEPFGGQQSSLILFARRPNIALSPLDEAPCVALRMNQTAFDRYLARRHFPSLDGLRCLSIVPVVWHHCTPRPLDGVLGKGPIGVDLFFCISGYLITTLLVRERRQSGTIRLGAFYARRGLRIFPLYYLVLGFYILYAWLLPPSLPQRAYFFSILPYYAVYAANWMIDFGLPFPVIFSFAWSLATEEQFYLFWPSTLRFVRSRGALLAMMSLLVALDLALELGALGAAIPQSGLARRILTSFATPIGLGSILALLLDHKHGHRALNAVLGHRASALAAFGLVVALIVTNPPLALFHLSLALLVAAVVLRPDHSLRWVTDNRVAQHIGRVSYGMYLWHLTLVTLVKGVLPVGWGPAWVVFALALPLSVGWATLSHRAFESRFLKLKDRFRAAQPQPRASGLEAPATSS